MASCTLSSPATGSWSGTTLVGIHYQDERDGDDDGWSDIAGYRRGAARQRVYWNNGKGRAVSGVAGATFEKREGGSDFAHQQLETKIADGGLFGEMPLGSFVLAGAGSLYVQSRVREFSDVREHDRRQGATLEITLRKSAPRNTWVTGIAADWFAVRTPSAPLLSASVAPRGGLFIHDDLQVTPWFRVSGTARVDYTKGAGEVSRVDRFFFSPRGSALVHNGGWSAGITAGQGYSVPTALTAETEAAGLSRLTIQGPLEIEEARSVSGNVAYRNSAAVLSLTLFHSRIEDPATLDRATYTLRTGTEPLVTQAVEVLGTARRAPFAISGTYTFIQARESDDVDVARTPTHSARFVAWAESAGRGRIGVRGSFTGEQRLDANPFRSTSEAYTLVGLFGEHRFGRLRSSSMSTTCPTFARRTGTRSRGRRVMSTAAGRWMPGRRSRAASSTQASGSRIEIPHVLLNYPCDRRFDWHCPSLLTSRRPVPLAIRSTRPSSSRRRP